MVCGDTTGGATTVVGDGGIVVAASEPAATNTAATALPTVTATRSACPLIVTTPAGYRHPPAPAAEHETPRAWPEGLYDNPATAPGDAATRWLHLIIAIANPQERRQVHLLWKRFFLRAAGFPRWHGQVRSVGGGS